MDSYSAQGKACPRRIPPRMSHADAMEVARQAMQAAQGGFTYISVGDAVDSSSSITSAGSGNGGGVSGGGVSGGGVSGGGVSGGGVSGGGDGHPPHPQSHEDLIKLLAEMEALA